jgi:hypothetical protein
MGFLYKFLLMTHVFIVGAGVLHALHKIEPGREVAVVKHIFAGGWVNVGHAMTTSVA